MEETGGEKDMHRRISWMVPADVQILEFLASARDPLGNPSVQSPRTISVNVGYSRKHVGNRCRTLADHGLIERLDRGLYRLTERGESLMDGGIPPSELDSEEAGS